MVSLHEALAEGRAEAEAIMTDSVRVTRSSSVPVTDPETWEVTFPSVTVHEGLGRVQARSSEAAHHEIGGAVSVVVSFQVQVPVTVDLRKNDLVEVLESDDPLMVGRVFTMEFVVRKTHATKTVGMAREGV